MQNTLEIKVPTYTYGITLKIFEVYPKPTKDIKCVGITFFDAFYLCIISLFLEFKNAIW